VLDFRCFPSAIFSSAAPNSRRFLMRPGSVPIHLPIQTKAVAGARRRPATASAPEVRIAGITARRQPAHRRAAWTAAVDAPEPAGDAEPRRRGAADRDQRRPREADASITSRADDIDAGRAGLQPGRPSAAAVDRQGGGAPSWWRHERQLSGKPWHSSTSGPSPCTATRSRALPVSMSCSVGVSAAAITPPRPAAPAVSPPPRRSSGPALGTGSCAARRRVPRRAASPPGR